MGRVRQSQEPPPPHPTPSSAQKLQFQPFSIFVGAASTPYPDTQASGSRYSHAPHLATATLHLGGGDQEGKITPYLY